MKINLADGTCRHLRGCVGLRRVTVPLSQSNSEVKWGGKIHEDLEGSVDLFAERIAQFLVMSFDAARDTPSKLKEVQSATAGAEGWVFLTAKEAATRQLSMALGIRYEKNPDDGYPGAGHLRSVLLKEVWSRRANCISRPNNVKAEGNSWCHGKDGNGKEVRRRT